MTDDTRMPLRARVTAGAFVVAMVAIAALAAWPIYGSGPFVLLVAVSVLVGAGIAALGARARWSPVAVALAAIGAYLVLGVPLAVPSSLTDPATAARGWLDLVIATVFGWKELVTVSMPVGSYQALLVPALAVFLFGSTAAFSFAWRTRDLAFLTVVATVLMQAFGLGFGSSAASGPVALGPVVVSAPRELALGLAGFVLSLAFLLWRVGSARRSAILAAGSSTAGSSTAGAASAGRVSGVRQRRASSASVLRRIAAAAAMLLVGVLVASTAGPAIGSAGDRAVLRAAVEPPTARIAEPSALSEYRDYLKNRYDAELFRVASDSGVPMRVRLATLSHYDGRFFRATDPSAPAGTEASAFVRIPYRASPEASGVRATVTVTVGEYSGLWLPTVGDLAEVRFAGRNAGALADGFFYNPATSSAIETRSLEPGDRYTLDAVLPDESVGVDELTAPTGGAAIDADLVPEQLIAWVAMQGGAPFGALVAHLTARGYLSHTVDAPTAEAPQAWVDALQSSGYRWAPSEAGHSIDRIDTLFGQLVRQQEQGGTDPAALVAGVGDDEQFATAVALLARYLGFDSRVVLGFRVGGVTDDDAIPACTDTCRGSNLTAWVEVQDASGVWVTVDATPQHTAPLAPDLTTQRNPEVPTIVTPLESRLEEPPAAAPSGSDSSVPDEPEAGTDLAWLAELLRTVGLALLLLLAVLAPFAGILIAKARRRAGRRRSTDAETRIVGGWDEFVDAALDHGYPAPTSETRSQVAAAFRTPHGAALATIADRAVFSPVEPGREESERFWRLVDQETLALARGMSRWQRWRAALSLRSLLRGAGRAHGR